MLASSEENVSGSGLVQKSVDRNKLESCNNAEKASDNALSYNAKKALNSVVKSLS